MTTGPKIFYEQYIADDGSIYDVSGAIRFVPKGSKSHYPDADVIEIDFTTRSVTDNKLADLHSQKLLLELVNDYWEIGYYNKSNIHLINSRFTNWLRDTVLVEYNK
jgi:hypothetical protein